MSSARSLDATDFEQLLERTRPPLHLEVVAPDLLQDLETIAGRVRSAVDTVSVSRVDPARIDLLDHEALAAYRTRPATRLGELEVLRATDRFDWWSHMDEEEEEVEETIASEIRYGIHRATELAARRDAAFAGIASDPTSARLMAKEYGTVRYSAGPVERMMDLLAARSSARPPS